MRIFEPSWEQQRENRRALLEILVGPLSEQLPWTARLQYLLSACFAGYGALVVGLWIMLRGSQDAAPDAVVATQGLAGILFGWLFTALFFFVKVVIVLGIPFAIIYSVLYALPSFKYRLLGYAGVVALVLFVDFIDRANRETTPQSVETLATPVATEIRAAQEERPEAAAPAQLEPAAAQTRAAHQALATEVDELSASARAKWRADVEAAGAFGDDGQIPPMLQVQEQDGGVVITNRGARQVCVSAARVARDANGNVAARCHLGLSVCTQIPTADSRRFVAFPGNAPTCAESPLEFRVGGVTNPEPTWWSRSALEGFDSSYDGHDHARVPAPMLVAEKADLLSLLEEGDRARRWRLELRSEP